MTRAKNSLVQFIGLAVLAGFLFFNFTTVGHGQDQTLDSLSQQWSQLDAQFTEKQGAIESGEGDTKALQDEYRDLLDKANELVKQMKTLAMKAIETNPAEKSATRTIMGILLNDAQNGNDAEVLKIGDKLIANNIDPRYFEVAAKADRLSIDAREIFEELLIRQRETKADDLPRVMLKTTKGDIVLELYENQAPNTVANFISLVESGHYADTIFHRVLEDSMAQTGGFKSDGSGGDGPGYSIPCECYTPETRPHFTGCISMAHIGQKDTGGAQFFLTFGRTMSLDGLHTCFGRIISDTEVLDKIERTHIVINGDEQPIPNIEKDKIITAEVIRKRDHEYKPKKVGDSEPQPKPTNDSPPAEPNLSPPVSGKTDDKKPDVSAPESGGDDKQPEPDSGTATEQVGEGGGN